MAILEQSSGVVKLDDASGTPVDISAQVESLTMGYETQSGEYYTLGTDYGYGIVGKAKVSIDLTPYHTTGATEALALLRAWALGTAAVRRAARTITVDVPDSNSGSTRITGEFKLGNLGNLVQLNAASNEPGKGSARLMCEGAPTVSTIAP